MNYEVKQELQRLKEMLAGDKIETGRYYTFLEEDYYVDDYSKNEIHEMQDEFLHYAEIYLKENYSGKYAIQLGVGVVIIVTKEHFDNLRWKYGWILC